METNDGRKIISGKHSTEKERQAALNSVQWKKWKELEEQISMRDTGTINIVFTKNQNRIQGMTGEINPWEHKEGDIGSTIDYCIELGILTKNQIAILAGSKISKINSHIKHLERDKGVKVIISNDDLVSFQNSKINRIIRLLFKSPKRKGEAATEVFAELLSALKLTGKNYYWDVKKRLWQVLDIDEAPVQLPKNERHPIIDRDISENAEIYITEEEDKILHFVLDLPIDSSKKDLERAIIDKVKNSFSEGIILEEEDRIKKSSEINETVKVQLIKARKGQGKFKRKVLEFENNCRITGVTDMRFLIASHIKP